MADTIIERLFNLAATDNIEGVIALTTHDTYGVHTSLN